MSPVSPLGGRFRFPLPLDARYSHEQIVFNLAIPLQFFGNAVLTLSVSGVSVGSSPGLIRVSATCIGRPAVSGASVGMAGPGGVVSVSQFLLESGMNSLRVAFGF